MTYQQKSRVYNIITSSIFISGLFGVISFFLAISLLFVIDVSFDRKPVYLIASISGTILYIFSTICMLMKKNKTGLILMVAGGIITLPVGIGIIAILTAVIESKLLRQKTKVDNF